MLNATDLKGIIPPTTTPLTSEETICRESVGRLMDFFVDAGVGGMFVLGSSGECPCMTIERKLEMVDAVADALAGRLPLLAGVTSPSWGVTSSLAHEFAQRGADAVVATTPYFFHYSQCELKSWFTRLAEESPVPLFIYDIPGRSDNSLTLDTVLALSEHERIIGLKDSSGDIERGLQLAYALAGRDDFSIFQGSERLLSISILMGYHGGVQGIANVAPRLCTAVYEAAVAGDVPETNRLQNLINKAFPYFFAADPGTTHGSAIVGAMKAVQELQGLCHRRPFFPMRTLTDDDVAAIRVYTDPLAEAGWITYA